MPEVRGGQVSGASGVGDAADLLRGVAEFGTHSVAFGGEQMERAAQAILAVHRRADAVIARALRVQRKAEEETKRLLASRAESAAVLEALVRILATFGGLPGGEALPAPLAAALADGILALPDAAVLDLERRGGLVPGESAARLREVFARAAAAEGA